MKNPPNSQQSDPRRQPSRRPNKKPTLPAYKRSPLSWLIVAIILFTAMMMLQQGLVTNTIRWDQFIQYLNEGGQVVRIDIGETEITGKFKEGSEAANENKSVAFKVNYRPDSGAKEQLNETLNNLHKLAVDNPKYDLKYDYTQQRIWMLWLLN